MTETTPRSGFGTKTIHGAAWRYFTFLGGKLIVFATTVILARLLTKDDFGLVAYAVTTITFLDVIGDLGIGSSVIYHPDDEKTSATAFWLGLLFGIFLFGVAWFMAPLVGAYFRDPRVVPIARAFGLSFPITALGSTHAAVIRKKLAFGRTVIPDLLMAMSKGLISIVLALLGYGAWSLVWGQVGGLLVSSIAFWFVTPWRPSLHFDLGISRSLIRYGSKLVGVELISVLLLNIDYLLIGRYLGAESLGVYTLAFRLPDLLILQFARILGSVIFPIFTHMRDIPGNLARGFSQAIRYVSLVTIPLGLGLMLVARPLTLTIFSAKWEEAIPVIQAIALYTMFLSLVYNAGDAYKADGRPQVITWLSVVQLALLTPLLWWATTKIGSIVMVGWVQALVALLSVIINLAVASRLLGLPFLKIIDALRPAALSGLIMAVVVYAALYLSVSLAAWLQLVISIGAGGIVYGAAMWVFNRRVVLDIVELMRSALGRG